MPKKRLHESLEAKLLATQSNINVDNLIHVWSTRKYGQLSVLLAALRSLAMIHQQHHWVSSGTTYYEDHLLFERLYNATNDSVDSVAEKCIGLGDESTVDLQLQLKTIWQFIKDNTSSAFTVDSDNSLVQKSLNAELQFLTLANTVSESLTANGLLTPGLDNMIAGLQDVHESHVYLLKQRSR